jgi:4-carboxymuconolactone decarboxylase
MARLSNITRDELKPEDQRYFDEIASSRGSVRGPFGVLLHSPNLASRVAATGHYVRFDFAIPEALKEVVIITTAREIKSPYEFAAHARLARAAGVSEDTIRSIAEGRAPQGFSSDETMLVNYVLELLRQHKVSDATYDAVKNRYGVQSTVDLTVLIGHYLQVGLVLAAFEVELPPGVTSELPA